MKYYKEHKIIIPSFLNNDNWKDTSWHNDACATSTYNKPLFDHYLRPVELVVWVDYPKNESELAECDSYMGRYWIEIFIDNKSHACFGNTNSVQKIQELVNMFLESYKE